MRQVVEIEWAMGTPDGHIEVLNGKLHSVAVVAGRGAAQGNRFHAEVDGRFRLRLTLDTSNARFGDRATIVTVDTTSNAFSFLTRDVGEAHPLFIAEYGVVILPEGSPATFQDVARDLAQRGGRTSIAEVEAAAEPTWEKAAERTQRFPCETVLGISRDQRTFTVSPDIETIAATRSLRDRPLRFQIPIGRGKGPRTDVKRRLDQGVLPILRATKIDGDITYEATWFATLMGVPLTPENVAGTHYLVAERGLGMEHTPSQQQQREAAERRLVEQPPVPLILCYQLRATNTARVPRPAFFYTPWIAADRQGSFKPEVQPNGELTKDGLVYAAATLAGEPWPATQVAFSLNPGESVVAEYRFPHQPYSIGEADIFEAGSFEHLLAAARRYWHQKLDQGGEVKLPENRLTEMAQAGLLHLDMITYGEQSGPLAATIGWYSPIGTESSPIIQFYDSMGWHDVARRSLEYFLAKQHDNGFMQNFGGYMLETGAALWSIGEHYRYTRDTDWVQRIAPKVKKACEWIIQKRRSDTTDWDAHGAGLMVGKVADPEDHYRQYMLNGYHYLGLARAAEMLAEVDPTAASRYQEEAEAFRGDIRRALVRSMAISPVVPLSDGRWVPSCPPWVETRGHNALGLVGDISYTHGSVYARDSIIGPLYTIFTEVLDPDELPADYLVEAHYETMCQEGIAFSQPYYSPHPQIHLRRGEVNTFLKALYNGIAGLADRETYTFWEHHFGASPHKTHEEGWFLMQLRWMLYMERGAQLDLLAGIPRRFLAHGEEISLRNVRSYFGPIDVQVMSQVDEGRIEVSIRCPQGQRRGLGAVSVRLPHPDGRVPTLVQGGRYDASKERVWIDRVAPEMRIVLDFAGAAPGLHESAARMIS